MENINLYNNDINDNKLFELYTLAELSYEKHFKNIAETEELYPPSWYEKNNYHQKIKILTEAIKTNTLIVNTPSYLESIEKTKTKTKDI